MSSHLSKEDFIRLDEADLGYLSRMARERERLARILALGRSSYVFRFGYLAFGIPCFVAVTFALMIWAAFDRSFRASNHEVAGMVFLLSLFVVLPFFLLLGHAASALAWEWNTNLYRRLDAFLRGRLPPGSEDNSPINPAPRPDPSAITQRDDIRDEDPSF